MTSETKVTVAIPTYNRSGLMKEALESALTQDYPDFRVLVLDNASTDNTESVVRSFSDPRITYVRNETNVGPLGNWNRAIELNVSPYLNILSDDDLLLPGFISESVAMLDRHENAGFSFTPATYVDINREVLEDASSQTDDMSEGVIDGLQFVELSVRSRGCRVQASSAMMRAAAIAQVGTFDALYVKFHFDLNLYLRLARKFAVAFIDKPLVAERQHAEQLTDLLSRRGHLEWALNSERLAGISYLLESNLAADAVYRRFLARRLHALLMVQNDRVHSLVPEAYWSPTERLDMARQEMQRLIPLGTYFVLVDNSQWGPDFLAGRRSVPFLERDGVYWGTPADDDTAIKELNRLRQCGAGFIVFAWPAFWWLDHYEGFANYLVANFRCALTNSRLVVFDLSKKY